MKFTKLDLAVLVSVISFPGVSVGADTVVASGYNLIVPDGDAVVTGSILVRGEQATLDVGENYSTGPMSGSNGMIGSSNSVISNTNISEAFGVYGNLLVGEANNVIESWCSMAIGGYNSIATSAEYINSLPGSPPPSYGSLVAGYGNTIQDYNGAFVAGMNNLMMDNLSTSNTGEFGAIIGGSNSLQADTGWIVGLSNGATGLASTTIGWQLLNHNHSAIVVGTGNVAFPSSPTTFLQSSPAFVLGNGDITGTERSNAIETLKNGETTLINKAWDPEEPLVEPSTPEMSEGRALVVDGHTVLNGKVIISVPQGDIPMFTGN